MRISRLMLILPLLALLAGCGSPPVKPAASSAAPTVDIEQIVQATLAALTAQATPVPPSVTPLPATATSSTGGSISGALNYPADRLPPMYVVAYGVDTQSYQYVVTNAGQAMYTIDDLPPGTYHVIAYTIGGDGLPAGMAGGFTQASIATATSSIPTGSIAGDLSYPSSFIPAERVVAFQVGSPSFYYVDTDAGQSHYQLDGLPPGTYHVVAYVGTGGLAGGYSEMVPCGLKVGCTDHTLIDVTVVSGQVTTGVDPKDFYAEPGTFPPAPMP